MKTKYLIKKNGFTFIEVALVLAIAGLIFLMIFVALPALQRSERDTERREDMALFLEAVKKYQENNRGALPTNSATSTSWNTFKDNYLGGNNFADPTGGYYKLDVSTCGTNISQAGTSCDINSTMKNIDFIQNDYQIRVVTQATCSGEEAVSSTNPRKIAILYKLEGVGIYCGNT